MSAFSFNTTYQMIPGIFRFVCTNGLVCGNNFGEIRVPHKGDIVGQVIEGAYEVLGVFDKVTENMETMKEIHLDNISKAPKNFSGLYLYYHPAALLCRLICLNFINWLFGSL